MKAIVENPLNVYHSPIAISLYVNMLNKIVQCNDEKELREANEVYFYGLSGYVSILFLITVSEEIICGSERENCKPLFLVEF